MKRKAVQVNISDYPETLSELLKDAPVYDSSCSKDAQVIFIDKDGGCFVKKAPKGTLKTESLMTEYLHSLGLSAEVLYYGSFKGSDFLLTGRIPGEDCTDLKYLSEPKRLCDTTAMLLRTLHEIEGSDCPVQDRARIYAHKVMKGFDKRYYEPDLFQGIWEFKSFDEARYIAEEGLPLLKKQTYCSTEIIACPIYYWMTGIFPDILTSEAAVWETGILTSFGAYGHSSSTSEQINIQIVSWMLMGRKRLSRKCCVWSQLWK